MRNTRLEVVTSDIQLLLDSGIAWTAADMARLIIGSLEMYEERYLSLTRGKAKDGFN